ncbi:non-ribosomal peptide synthetase [Actinacidiphila yeochonensis]|uniref:non-ribosomal peptide synthetase n=1 Tax=Actinacidiphila yeochonensis TaxID=89050 RepID=UPI0018E3BB04|nr:non-ribosomal peptide synthetase [Actinacidiphila yeochonensis]
MAAGEPAAVEELREVLAEHGVTARPLSVRHAFHSRHADALLDDFAALVADTPVQEPKIPVVSSLTGRLLTAEEASSPRYWARQLREAVRFADALRALPDSAALLEAGPGTALSGFARRTLGGDRLVLPVLGGPRGGGGEPPARLTAVARLWERGADVDWTALGERTGRGRVPLPTYPFERTRHWFEPSAPAAAGAPAAHRPAAAAPDPADESTAPGRTGDWLHVLAWSPSAPPAPAPGTTPGTVLLLADASGLAEEVAARLAHDGVRVHMVRSGAPDLPGGIGPEGEGHRLDADSQEAFRGLAAELSSRGTPPDAVVSCWAVDAPALDRAPVDDIARCALRAVTVPAALARALGERFPGRPVRMLLVSDAALAVGGQPPRAPHAATALGPARVLPLELPGSTVRVLDLDCAGRSRADLSRAADAVVAELAALGGGAAEPVVAVRGRARLLPSTARPALDDGARSPVGPPGGAWLITGGMGGIGTAVAAHLAERGRTLVLLTRRPVPDGPDWQVIRPKNREPARFCPPGPARALAELAAKGAEVCLVQCDVADERGLAEALDQVRRRYGRIAGVVHAAGLPGGGVMTLRRPEDVARVLEPKVRGTVLLHRLTGQDRPVMVLCSSLLSVAGAAGQADYAGANAFLDSFAHATDTAVSIGWDRWSETGMAVRSGTADWAEGEGEPLGHPLFDARRDGPDGSTDFRLRRGPHTTWLSDEHRLAEEPVLPGTALLDLALAAYRLLTVADHGCAEPAGDPAPVELDAVFTSPLRIPDARPPVVVVRLRPHPEGGHGWEVHSSASAGRPHGQGRVRSHDGPRPGPLDLDALRAPAAPAGAPRDRGPGGLLATGPRWACVARTHRDEGSALLVLRLPEHCHGDTAVHPLHPALLDAATGAVAEGTGGHLPAAYRRLIVHQDLAAEGYAHIVLRSGDPEAGGTLVADVTLTGPDGRPAAVVEGFVLRPVPTAPDRDPAAGDRGADGIPTRRGLRALDLVLANPHLPHVLVTPRLAAGSGRARQRQDAAPSNDLPGPDGLPGRVARIWARMLGVPVVGADDNLFELGADSLAVVQIAAEMRNAGLAVSPGDLFAHPTAAALADRIGAEAAAPAALAEARGGPRPGGGRPTRRRAGPLPGRGSHHRGPGAGASPVPVRRGHAVNGIEDIYPLSPAQEGMLFHTSTSPGHGLYVETTTFRLLGELDLRALTEAWRTVAARHPVLRTGFVHERISAPHQVVLPDADVRVDFRDLSELDEAARADSVAAEVARGSAEPFDLTRPPLMRLLALRLRPDEHLMVWTYHHMILDGWSAALLMAEVTAELGQPGGSSATPPPFREYVAWLRRQDPERDRVFWTDYLAGYREPAVLTLPGTRPGAKPSGGFRTVRALLPARTSARLRAVAAARSITLSSLVEAAWAGTVARYSGRDDVVVGVTVAGRPPLARAEDMIGMFINTVPVRARVEPDATAEEWLERYASSRHPVLEHQHTPLTDVGRWAGTDHGVHLFDTVVVFENYPDPSEAALSGTALRITDVRYETRTNYNATLVVRAAAELRLQLVVDAAVFGEGEAEGLLRHVTAVLERLGDRPAMSVRELLAVPQEDRALLLDRWNGTDVDRTPPRALLADLIDGALAARPDHPAVVADDATYTYRELDARATALARRLEALGTGPGDRVGLCLGRRADLVTALLAVARSGAAFVPLDPAHPAERTAYVLRDADPVLVVTDTAAAPGLEGWEGAVLDVTREDLATVAETEAAAPPAADPDGLAYVIYTSGSTGRPKGVAVGHRALANLVDSLALRHPGLCRDDRFLALTTLTFDTSLAELLVPLAVGATIHLGGRKLGLSGREVDAYTTRHGITALQATPSRYRALLDTGWQGSGRPRLYSCGEAFPPDLAEPLAKRGQSVWNMYGPTETTVYSSVEEVHAETTRITVGRPISNTVLRVLDPRGDLVPIGCVGELCIGGDGVAEGYWNRPELSAERFAADPYAEGSRMFRTGDHARTLPDGRVEVLGRMDRQLKLRGYRIEPGEIEQVLLEAPQIAAAAVAVRDGRLVAWTVPADRTAPAEPDRLRERLRHRLPSYMIPEILVAMDELPLTPAGKTDLLSLTVPSDEPAPTRSDAPRATSRELEELEELVVRIFRDVLALPEVGLDDDFFHHGGDSLRAMRVASRIQAELDPDFDVEMLFSYATAREVAAEITRSTAAAG